MKLFVIADIHGCLNTFRNLLHNYWNTDDEILIQVGDLIDRGNFSPETLMLAYGLNQRYGNNIFFLKGNHEYELIRHFENGPNDNWLRQGGNVTLTQFEESKINLIDYMQWIKSLPLKWENGNILITHAGISPDVINPFEEKNKNGVLWNRGKIKNIGKLQIYGHTPTRKVSPIFEMVSNSYNIDSGAYLNYGLSAVKISEWGEVLELINVPTSADDISIQDKSD
jgi:serine/threonine protein phosphatase 1